MSDQPALAFLEQFFRSFARPDLDRMVEERVAKSLERGRRAHVRFLSASLDSLEAMYGFLQGDVRRLEQRLDELHVLIERGESSGVPLLLENSSHKYEDAFAGRIRLRKYLAELGESIERIDDRPAKDSLQAQSMDLPTPRGGSGRTSQHRGKPSQSVCPARSRRHARRRISDLRRY